MPDRPPPEKPKQYAGYVTIGLRNDVAKRLKRAANRVRALWKRGKVPKGWSGAEPYLSDVVDKLVKRLEMDLDVIDPPADKTRGVREIVKDAGPV